MELENADGVSSFAYNNYDILCMETDPLGLTTRYIYSRTTDLMRVIRPNHYAPDGGQEAAEHFTYDAFHNWLSRTDETGAVLKYGYDSQNRRVSESRKISDTACQTFRYRYDAVGRMTELHRTADREGSGRRSVMVRCEYDRNGNMTAQEDVNNGVVKTEKMTSRADNVVI